MEKKNMWTKLNAMNCQIANLTKKRNDLLRELRKKCKHLRLVELDYSCAYSGAPPFRICADCGAEERGWYCGYQVLALRSERTDISRGVERAIIRTTRSADIFYSYRKSGPLYYVGQSHPNFKGGGEV
ncbi:MAG: hypothetical protein A2655_03375 [Candidatus Yanofskybacteria bacterium RIFCSPHIGHO2_01_FULL_43_42]|uniref:Uncharacterized protein n=1 Tax=Candidatus Yanofskybacteria bacterium RIFCSPLOWO2_01_FULL_43_22 TaxID=1802695 RepID=A0A1F8GES6_9BACT|nr:MAG: hypothetical protein A2655_03375 [Candidatus Yanofskybacteria bacterium RIFCSPHIGHO2_01_FULL_43_42]OGN13036.1 MAG: hypothetical protein A3D48_04035 [Candidatus Yanofskybacteria bacterium RIFCSPHIGHO2_02_FULL_43_17]OGN23884.1 MAG: hypothetical protein A3A13_02225 [Candidatus Yanofskybacteria bacterium RIFCSPLOWO2_01_FULL_43_22]